MNSNTSRDLKARLQDAAEAVFTAAQQDGSRVSIVIVDSSGHDLLVLRDDAPWFTVGVARSKAATAALIGIPTTSYAGMLDAFPELSPLIAAQIPHQLTTLAGGVPLPAGSGIVGGIGVSGAMQADQDRAYAEAGARILVQA